jgi:hypothetical protein
MVEEVVNPNEIATFNSAAEYTKSLITLERGIAETMFNAITKNQPEQFLDASELIDLLWLELYEWIEKIKGETERQDEIRTQQRDAAKRIKEALKNKQGSINTNDVELFKLRIIMLKQVINKSGLRMPKSDDQSGTPSLMRKAQNNFRRF